MRRTLLIFTLATMLLVPICLFAVPVAEQDKSAAKRIQSLHDLPSGAAPAVIKAMLRDLPEEYQLQENDHGFFMENLSCGIKVIFTSDGPQIKFDGHNWNIRLSGIGYEGSVQSVEEPLLINDAGMIVYERSNVAEWYINSRWGIEQGFTIKKAPEGKNRNNLVVELSLSGDLYPVLIDHTLVLTDTHGEDTINYTGLHVFDADSNSLPSRLVLTENTLHIIVDDTSAKYPVTIDPWIQAAKLTSSDGAADDWFGSSVAISGDTIVIRRNYDNSSTGSAYVFIRPETGWANMTQTAKLTPSDGVAGDWFGSSVAMSGDTIVVGAMYDDDKGNESGSAYIFIKPETGWKDMTQTAKLTTSDGVAGDYFGTAAAISGDTIVVATHSYNNGSAYVFIRPETGWANMTQTAKLTASDGVAGDYFGEDVAISGDTIVVGARFDDDKGDGSGSAYVYTKPGIGWEDKTQTAKLTADDGVAGDFFGSSVAISDETIVVGAYFGGDNGSVYVYTEPETGWADNIPHTAKLTASDGVADDNFGTAVAISGDTIVVGAKNDDNKGSAYIYIKPESGWINNMPHTGKLRANDRSVEDYFGASIAISNDAIVVGAMWDDDKGEDSGSAYVYEYIYKFPWAMFLPAVIRGTK